MSRHGVALKFEVEVRQLDASSVRRHSHLDGDSARIASVSRASTTVKRLSTERHIRFLKYGGITLTYGCARRCSTKET